MPHTWIWLPKDIYPEHQYTKFDVFKDKSKDTFVVAEFQKSFQFEKTVRAVSVCFSADTEVQLFCNDRIIATGPPMGSGDFLLGSGEPKPWYYASATEFSENSGCLAFFARVKMCPLTMSEFSKGHGGFMLSAKVTFADGSEQAVAADDTWLARKNGAYTAPCEYNGSIAPDEYVCAEIVPDIWSAQIAPIPVRTEKEIALGTVTLAPGEMVTKEVNLNMIHAGFAHISADGSGPVSVTLESRECETDRFFKWESATLQGNDEYRSFHMRSVGSVLATVKNEADDAATVRIGLITTHYPTPVEATTVTSDDALNTLLHVCRHTLKICRQTHHLDSPGHCEPLACAGDYYIAVLMTVFSFGDMRLAEFDVARIADILRTNDGRMFHTTYSLIWVRMLYDVYMFGGTYALLEKCRDALDILLARFATYLGENGLIENPPDYMFVDWIYVDGLSLHHPPRALGQTVLNMLYFMALGYAERIYAVLGDTAASALCKKKKDALQIAVNTLLYDAEKGMYFEGLNTPVPAEKRSTWQPQNVEKRYYLKHSNIMAAYTSICDRDTARNLIEKIMRDEIEGNVQPYFLHYLLEAIDIHGLREKYTLSVVERWMPSIRECSKGLVEGFFAPAANYSFDHCHAWGGTPLYSLPKALTGLSIEAAGYKKIKLKPSLLGLHHAKIEIPTPYGMVTCDMKQGQTPRITAPSEISVTVEL